MNGLDLWPIIKWVLIVLVAAFIGQFGRSFAQHLIGKARRKKESGKPGAAEVSVRTEPAGPVEAGRSRLKAEKKALKALAKMRKKENP